ncbi:hypothetical protein B6I21_03470 [candidate division KSB1 bacterium 4572_119]|nr:MAG: hypothetical protein B6I21_03470 [candidate division KSB1 bacterium 4572_119]
MLISQTEKQHIRKKLINLYFCFDILDLFDYFKLKPSTRVRIVFLDILFSPDFLSIAYDE